LLLAKKFPVVVLILGAKTFVVIRIELVLSPVAHHGLVESPNTARPRLPRPSVVAAVRILVAIPNRAGTA